jgi:hypothetical protein
MFSALLLKSADWRSIFDLKAGIERFRIQDLDSKRVNSKNEISLRLAGLAGNFKQIAENANYTVFKYKSYSCATILLKKRDCSPNFKFENKRQKSLPKYCGKISACSKQFRACSHVRGSSVSVCK